jgi:hypothetical protein
MTKVCGTTRCLQIIRPVAGERVGSHERGSIQGKSPSRFVKLIIYERIMMKTRNTLAANLLQYVRDNPGATGTEIHNRFRPGATKASVSATLGRLQRMGLIKNQDPTGSRWSVWYPIECETPEPAFLEKARTVLEDLAKVPKSEREMVLALYLQNLKSQEKLII